MKATPHERLMEQVRFVGATDADCWEFTGYRNPRGYGRMSVRSRLVLTHRLAYEEAAGPVPDGLCVLHRCDNPPCCNPSHLFLGTRAENNADKIAKGRAVIIRGERQGGAKLTDCDVRAIRRLHREGATKLGLSKRFGVSRPVISGVIEGTLWSHVA